MIGTIYADELAAARRRQLLTDAAEYRLARRARGLLPVGRRARLVAQAALAAAATQLRQSPVPRRTGPHPVGPPSRRPGRAEIQILKDGSRKVPFDVWSSRTNRHKPRSRVASCTTPGR